MKIQTPLGIALGAALVGSLALSPAAGAFQISDLDQAYERIDDHKKEEKKDKDKEGACGEGKCGEGKCGSEKDADTDTEKDKEGACGEGKCGEGKCGSAA